LKQALYHDCPEEDFERARRLISPQPAAPLGTPIEVTDENFGRVRRTYVHTTQDRTISPSRPGEDVHRVALREGRLDGDRATYRSSPHRRNWRGTWSPWQGSSLGYSLT
jgi:hypothetical protein